jgi:lipid A disaccharide synthetase
MSFYRELGAMPRVMVLSPWEESRVSIVNADIVISNTGTSSLEASMLGIPGVTATRMYFEKLMVVPAFDPSIERVSELLEKAKIWKENFNSKEFRHELGKIKKNQFSGNCGDFKTDVNVMSSQNITKLHDAFKEVIESYST